MKIQLKFHFWLQKFENLKLTLLLAYTWRSRFIKQAVYFWKLIRSLGKITGWVVLDIIIGFVLVRKIIFKRAMKRYLVAVKKYKLLNSWGNLIRSEKPFSIFRRFVLRSINFLISQNCYIKLLVRSWLEKNFQACLLWDLTKIDK